MRAQGAGRIINISSVGRFAPQPFMAAYVATEACGRGYSESLDHEVREHGVRVLLVEPFNATPRSTRTWYARQRSADLRGAAAHLRRRVGGGDEGGDDPAVVGKTIVAAGTDLKPKLRYPAGPRADASTCCAASCPRTFDKSVRKLNRMAS